MKKRAILPLQKKVGSRGKKGEEKVKGHISLWKEGNEKEEKKKKKRKLLQTLLEQQHVPKSEI